MARKEQRLICTAHGELGDLIGELEKLDTPSGFKRKVKRILKRMYEVVDEVTEYGQRMEDRLYDYHDTITSLGFKRTKKKRSK